MSLRHMLKFCLIPCLALFSLVPNAALAQQPAGATVRGLVADPDDAVIPGATITLTPTSGKALTTTSGGDGTYTLRAVPAGVYSVTVTMKGFASFVKQGVRITAAQTLALDAKLAIQTQKEEVQVSTNATTLSVDSDSNASSTVIKGKDLDALSDDPDELSNELSALAGPAAGPNGGQIYVDGFTGGQLPPKSSIREIRINQNPFSAQYERLGYGRVEVFTKPGTDKFHGSFQVNGNTSALNTGNGYIATQPPYHTIFFFGNITGPINSRSSFALAGSRRAIQDNTIVKGTISGKTTTSTTRCEPGDTTCVDAPYSFATPFPQNRFDLSPRIDFAISEKNTLITRFQMQRSDSTNDGVGGFDLPTTAYNASNSEYELQVSDTQIISARVINESRFELGRNRNTQASQFTTPSVSVSGAFTDGGSASGTATSRQARLELQNYTSVQLSKNFIRFGGRLRLNRQSSNSNAGTNGTFTYASLDDYRAAKLSQFSITRVITGSVAATLADVGLYLEDDWKARPNLSLTAGIRYETQNDLSGNQAIAPRVSFAYGLGSSKGTPKTVIRGGFGIFFDRYQIGNVLTTRLQNGTNQQKLVLSSRSGVIDPHCSPSNASSVAACGTPAAGTTTTYSASSHLRTPYTLQFAIGADQQLFKGATLSVNYLNARGVHQFYSQNISYSPTGTTGPAQYQYQSGGVFRQNQLITNFNYRTGKAISLFGYYVLNFAKSDTSGFGTYPTVPGNLAADYGRASFDTRSRLFIGGSISLKYRISLSPFIVAQSGTPYNVTLGNDQNGDTLLNDRPSFTPGLSTANCKNAKSFGTPALGVINYTEIPINYCTGPALFTTNLRINKLFGFGPSTARPTNAGDGGGPGGPRGGGGGPRGGGGPGGFGGASSGKRYNLNLGVQLQNLFNVSNKNSPVGVLSSTQLFGQSTQLAGNIYTSNSAVRRVSLQLSFNF
jgi:hypothetical protein